MSQVVTIDSKIIKNLLDTLQELKAEITRLNQKFETEPPYGSDQWWEWSDRKAKEDIKAGKTVKFDSVKEAIKWLNS